MGVKSSRQKKFFFPANFALLAGFFFGIGATICIGREMLCLLYVFLTAGELNKIINVRACELKVQ